MARDVEIWRSALRLIQDCGKNIDPKQYAFAKSSEAHANGDIAEATRWAEIANTIDLALEDVKDPEHVPTDVH